MRRPEALIYDLGNVLVDIDFQRVFRFWAERGGSREAELAARFVMGPAYQDHERGRLSTALYWSALRSELELSLDDQDFAAGWAEIFCGSDPTLPELLEARSRSLRQCVLSNTNALHLEQARALFSRIFAPMEKVFASNELGMRKPEPAIYARVTEELRLEPQAILFCDDNPENLAAAARYGWQVQWIPNTRALADWLRNLRE